MGAIDSNEEEVVIMIKRGSIGYIGDWVEVYSS